VLDQKINDEVRNGTSLTAVLMGDSDSALPTSEYYSCQRMQLQFFISAMVVSLHLYLFICSLL
jgi:hypothetical protein